MNIFEQYGIKEVADVTIYAIELDKHDREIYVPVMYLDTLKVSTLEQTADQTTAKGGHGNADLIAWDYGKAIDLNIEDALYTPASQSLMWGGKFGTKKPRVRGLWNPIVYPKDRYGRTNYVKRTRIVYGEGDSTLVPELSPGFYTEDKINQPEGLEFSCRKVTRGFYIGPITNMNNLVSDFPIATKTATTDGIIISPFNQYNEGNWNVHYVDNEKGTRTENEVEVKYDYRDDYRTAGFYTRLQDLYPDVAIYRKSTKISDSDNIADLNDTGEYIYFTFITDELIAAFEEIQGNMKAEKNKLIITHPAIGEITTFLDKMSESIKYMKAHKYELGVFNEAHLISATVKDTFLFMIEKYFKKDFFSRVTYDLNACETAYELYKYSINNGELKYQDLSDETYMSKLICPLGYDTIEEKKDGSRDLLEVYNWSNLSSKLTQSNRPERAEIILDNYGDFNYYNQPMGITKKYYVGGEYLDTEEGASFALVRKVADTYENNKELVMQYFDHFTYAVKKGKLAANPYKFTENYRIYLKKPSSAYADDATLSWAQVLQNIDNVTTIESGKTVQTKYFGGTYGTYSSSVQNPNVKNVDAMQEGFVSRQRKVGEANWLYHVFFNTADSDYQYAVKKSNVVKYSDNSSAYYIEAPLVTANSPADCYILAELKVEALKNKISDTNYQFVSPQFKAIITSETSENVRDLCMYGYKISDSLGTCTNSKTAHSYIWADTNLKMVSFEGDQDIYYSEHANLRYRTPQNSSIKEIGIAQQGFYATSTTSEYKVKKSISFTFNYYGQKYLDDGVTLNESKQIVDLTMSLSNILSDFNISGTANRIVNQLKKSSNKDILIIGQHRYGDFTLTDSSTLAEFIANKCNEFTFSAKASKFVYGQTDNALSMTITIYGSVKGDYKWAAIDDNEITSVTSLERRFNEKESYGYFLKDYSPIVSFYKTIKTNSVGGNTNLIRVPVGDFYIISDWNYDGSTEYDYPYAIESGMEDTAVLDRMEKCRATRTFAINTSRNVTMFNYSTIPAYSHTPLTAFIDPRTMKPYEPNADSFTRANGDVIEGTLRIIKKDEIYYKWTRTVAPEHNSVGRSIIVDAEHFPGTYRIVGETYARLRADGKDQRYQFEIPLAKLSADTNLTLQADGDPTTFGMKFKVLRKRNGQMMKFTQYTVDSQDYNGYKSGSTKVVAVDASAVTTDNEIAREVNAI